MCLCRLPLCICVADQSVRLFTTVSCASLRRHARKGKHAAELAEMRSIKGQCVRVVSRFSKWITEHTGYTADQQRGGLQARDQAYMRRGSLHALISVLYDRLHAYQNPAELRGHCRSRVAAAASRPGPEAAQAVSVAAQPHWGLAARSLVAMGPPADQSPQQPQARSRVGP